MKRKTLNSPISIYQVDAFADQPFKGNPAAVCILQKKIPNELMQLIASEMNLSETAFTYPLEEKPLAEVSRFSLRWFTPKVEVPLCGHATLATAAVLFDDVHTKKPEITFKTKSGDLLARKESKGICLDFPADDPATTDAPMNLIKALGAKTFENAAYSRQTKKILIHLSNEKEVRQAIPDYEAMKNLETEEEIKGVILTSLGEPPYDFVSRYFAPWIGINEDPVTGSAHTTLTPYWAKILCKEEMLAYQASARGGILRVRLKSAERVELVGSAIIVMKGTFFD
ncbi:MAG: PhzF family phenazine biosynthesis protein [Candidatus Bathyarchaeota archaeon]|nr:MAG: PhzF family phenazine biosynthesis protein [Candidatus Bathyarchaeota archaeon]